VHFEEFKNAINNGPLIFSKELNETVLAVFKKFFVTDRSLVIFSSSGTTGAKKLICCFKEDLLNVSERSCRHFGIIKDDIYADPFNGLYVAKLLIFGRAYVSGCKVVSYSGNWNPANFYKFLIQQKVSVTSLVPTQLFDLAALKVSPPKSLKLVFVSGGTVDEQVTSNLQKLGWPIIETFGCAETLGMFAVKKESKFEVFRQNSLKQVGDYMAVSGEGLARLIICNGQANLTQEWLLLYEKFRVLSSKSFMFFGRGDEFLKIKGYLINVHEIFELKKGFDQLIIELLPDPRLGTKIRLVSSSAQAAKDAMRRLVSKYHFLHDAIEVKERKSLDPAN